MPKQVFRKDATLQERSHGVRRRYKGCTVAPDGHPRSTNSGPGGNTSAGKAKGHTKWARMFWERDGKRNAPPASFVRGWK